MFSTDHEGCLLDYDSEFYHIASYQRGYKWGFDENEDAKKSYQKYLSLMKSQNKDLNKVPKRVYERIK